MGDMLEKILKNLSVPDSELPSPSIPAKSVLSSPSPPPSPRSSNDDRLENGRERKPSSMTTPISRLTIVRRPWIEYLKENRERWIREAG